MTVIGVVAPGAMGSAVAQRLVQHGARVLTETTGRSAATRARAEASGMEATDAAGLLSADMILSIVPPAEALPLARRLSAAMPRVGRRPTYVDCNAVDVRTTATLESVITQADAIFVDAGIIGAPPKPGARGPTFYLSGPGAQDVAATLGGLGLAVKAMTGPVGAASALKMSYAGITKGLTAIGSMMILGAERAGAGPALRAELAESQPQLLSRFSISLPDMVPKAYRWVAEMREIAAFLQDDPAASSVFEGVAAFYDQIASDAAGDRTAVDVINRFLAQS